VIASAWVVAMSTLGACSSRGYPITEGASFGDIDSLDGTRGGSEPASETSFLAATGVDGEVEPGDTALGWAGVGAEGVPRGVVGGAGGDMVTVTSLEELAAAVSREEPLVVSIERNLEGVVRIETSNKTILGAPGVSIDGGLEIVGPDDRFAQNIIVRNLTIRGTNCPDDCSDADAFSVRRATHVWIDHCDISDGDDANLDITEESDYVTVSWTRFSYSTAERDKRESNLVGGSDDDEEDADDLRVTFHHNWWAENVDKHMPRIRFGQVHVVNNYYSAAGSSDCIRLGLAANVRVENNVFDGVEQPIGDPIDPSASALVVGNLAMPVALQNFVEGEVFDPLYSLVPMPADEVAARVRAEAGPTEPR